MQLLILFPLFGENAGSWPNQKYPDPPKRQREYNKKIKTPPPPCKKKTLKRNPKLGHAYKAIYTKKVNVFYILKWKVIYLETLVELAFLSNIR